MARSDTGCIRITPFGSFVKACRKALLELRRQRRPIARKTRKSLISLLSLRSLQPELGGGWLVCAAVRSSENRICCRMQPFAFKTVYN
jgi:hypothetical protein